jgi:hypothetical protein
MFISLDPSESTISRNLWWICVGIGLLQATLEENRWVRVVAKEIKGFPREIVVVDSLEYKALSDKIRSQDLKPLRESHNPTVCSGPESACPNRQLAARCSRRPVAPRKPCLPLPVCDSVMS